MGGATRPGATLQGKPSDEVVEADGRGDVVVVVADSESVVLLRKRWVYSPISDVRTHMQVMALQYLPVFKHNV
ncbi:hypothetical protein E5D57_009204 [Metarhizium anisopliae]|nr:hypothetical protein E5D57_009204 [Metarhizium anisopliae]